MNWLDRKIKRTTITAYCPKCGRPKMVAIRSRAAVFECHKCGCKFSPYGREKRKVFLRLNKPDLGADDNKMEE